MLVVTSLWRAKLFSLTYVPIGTSLRRLKLVGFIHVPVRRRKDVSNRSISLTYQLWHRYDVLAWYATSRPIWDRNETSLRRRMAGGTISISGRLLLQFPFCERVAVSSKVLIKANLGLSSWSESTRERIYNSRLVPSLVSQLPPPTLSCNLYHL